MPNQVMTLYIEDNSLKVLVAKGREIKKWAGLSLDPGLVTDGVINNPAVVADMLKTLLKTQGIQADQAVVGLSAQHCLSRVISLPVLPKSVLPEAVMREAERLLPVALEDFYVSWQVISTSDEQTKIFLVACPRNASDVLAETLRRAGIRPNLMDLAYLALTRVVSEPTAIIADNRPGVSDIVVMIGGVPELIRSIPFLTEDAPQSEKVSIFREEVERTIKFYNTNNPERAISAEVPIYVSGELADEPELLQSLSSEMGHPVLPLVSPLKCPEGLEVNRYAVNIGLALRKLSPAKVADRAVVNLNVIPRAGQPKGPSLAKMLVPAVLVIAVGLLVPATMVVQNTVATTASVSAELDTVNQIMKQKLALEKSQNKEITELKGKVNGLEKMASLYTSMLDDYTLQQEIINGDLVTATKDVPVSVIFSNISHRDNLLTISGMSTNEADILQYARGLDGSGRFAKITVTTLAEGGNEDVSFTIDLEVKE